MSADQLGLVLLGLITHTLLPARAPLLLAVDDTLRRRLEPRRQRSRDRPT